MVVSRRMGGRAARKALRDAPLTDGERPIWPGMESDLFKPLSDVDVGKIHGSVLVVLESLGLSQALPSCIDMVVKAGGKYIADKDRLLFPRALVLDTIANANRNVILYGQDPKHDLDVSGKKTYFGTAGAAVHVVDVDTREYKDSTMVDLYNIARLVDKMDNIHFLQRPLVCRDLTDPFELDFNTCYACIMGTSKHVGTSWVLKEHLERTIPMLHAVAGSEKKWRERPFVSCSNCFVVPPLRFAQESCDVLESAVYAGMPVLLLAAGQAGATSPAALAGAVVQEVAEVLAGLVYVNLLVPGHPAIFGTWPFVSDLRTGAMSGGSGEQAVLMAACGQMGRYYDLPTGVAAGMSDAKMPDAQSGYEKSYTDLLAGHSGANLVYESAGMHGSLLGCCYESFVIDNDMLGAINRTLRGIEVTDETMSVQAMRDVCLDGPSHYLGHEQTINFMQSEYVYPEIGDRTSPKEWKEQGSTTILERAKIQVSTILDNHYPAHISSATDAVLRELGPVKMPRSAMIKEQ